MESMIIATILISIRKNTFIILPFYKLYILYHIQKYPITILELYYSSILSIGFFPVNKNKEPNSDTY